MDATKIGKQIAELRREKGLTQQELASKLHVTDGAVSKWERGINFPNLSLLESLANALETSVIHLLSIENETKQNIACAITEISMSEKAKLVREIKQRTVLNIVVGIMVIICLMIASVIFKHYQIYGLANGVTIGAIGFVGTMIISEFILLRNLIII